MIEVRFCLNRGELFCTRRYTQRAWDASEPLVGYISMDSPNGRHGVLPVIRARERRWLDLLCAGVPSIPQKVLSQDSLEDGQSSSNQSGETVGIVARFAASGDWDHTMEGASLGCWSVHWRWSTCDCGRRRCLGIRVVIRRTRLVCEECSLVNSREVSKCCHHWRFSDMRSQRETSSVPWGAEVYESGTRCDNFCWIREGKMERASRLLENQAADSLPDGLANGLADSWPLTSFISRSIDTSSVIHSNRLDRLSTWATWHSYKHNYGGAWQEADRCP